MVLRSLTRASSISSSATFSSTTIFWYFSFPTLDSRSLNHESTIFSPMISRTEMHMQPTNSLRPTRSQSLTSKYKLRSMVSLEMKLHAGQQQHTLVSAGGV